MLLIMHDWKLFGGRGLEQGGVRYLGWEWLRAGGRSSFRCLFLPAALVKAIFATKKL